MFRGELADPTRIRLLAPGGGAIPVQGRATGYWPEGTVRFLCIDFLTDIRANATKEFVLEFGRLVVPASAVMVRPGHGDRVRILTEAAIWDLGTGSSIATLTLENGNRPLPPVTGIVRVCADEKGTSPVSHPLTVDSVEVTETGPVQTTVHLLGHYGMLKAVQPTNDETAWRYAVSMHFRVYRTGGKAYLQHSFGYNGDEYRDFVHSYGLSFSLDADTRQPIAFAYGGEGGRAQTAPLGVRINQFAHDAWSLSGTAAGSGRRFGGWAALTGAGGGLLVTMREAWQNWPVAIRAGTDGRLTCEILGEKEGRALDLRYEDPKHPKALLKSRSMYNGEELGFFYYKQPGPHGGRARGLVKIHEMLLDLSRRDPPQQVSAAFQKPLVPWAGQQRMAETRAVGTIGVYDKPEYDFLRRYFSVILDAYPIVHKANGLYGWVDWGDMPMPLRFDEKKNVFELYMDGGAGWCNSEKSLAAYFFHYAAGGGRRFLDLGRSMAHHTIGIDLEHAGGEMLRGDCHRHNQVHWRHMGGPRQGGWRGWHTYYWLTGDPEVGRLAMLDGSDSRGARRNLDLTVQPEPMIRYRYGNGSNYAAQLLALHSWITTGDARFTRAHPILFKLWKHCGELGCTPANDRIRVLEIEDGKPVNVALGRRGPLSGYFLTYGADDLMVEWMSLTGDSNAVDALLLQSRYYGPDRPGGRYHTPDGLFAGLAALEPNHPHLKKLLLDRLRQNRGLAAFREREPIGDSNEWSVLDWVRRGGALVFGKNEFMLAGAQALEALYWLYAWEKSGGGQIPR